MLLASRPVPCSARLAFTPTPVGMALLTSATDSGINNTAAVAATRGDLGQLAPRKKLLKSFSSFPENLLRPSEHFGTEGFSFLPPCCPNRNSTIWTIVILSEAKDLNRSVVEM